MTVGAVVDSTGERTVIGFDEVTKKSIFETPKPRTAIVKDLSSFITEPLPPQKFLLSPFLTERSIGMVHAWRGVGKTHTLMGMAVAMATGGDFWRWSAPEPLPVLYIDGEMVQQDLQQWLAQAVYIGGKPLAPHMFSLIGSDFEDLGIPSLSGPIGQQLVMDTIAARPIRPKAIFLDNISSLFRPEPEQDEWADAQEWLLTLRRMGFATILAHHDGKGLTQRGTSKREDIMNWVAQLKHPADYDETEGMRAEVRFEKSRGVHGNVLRSFEVQLANDAWTVKEGQAAMAERVVRMKQVEELSFRAIARELSKGGKEVSKSKVERIYGEALGAQRAQRARDNRSEGTEAEELGF